MAGVSARQEKVREALRFLNLDWDDAALAHAAALREVEEWEARLADMEFLAGINKALMPYQERAVAAEAERDRLAALLVEHHAAGVLDGAVPGDTCPVCARAALAAAQESER